MDLSNNPCPETISDQTLNNENPVDGPVDTNNQLSKDRESKPGRDPETNHTSGGDESEEYESANEGDTDGEAAAVDEAAAASVALTVMTAPLVNSSPVEPSFATPPTVTSSQQSSPDREEGASVEPIVQTLNSLNITDGSSTLTKQPSQVDNCILASTEISDDHPPEEVESKEAEESSTDNENMSHRLATAVSTPLDVRDNNLMIWDQTNSNGSMSVSSSAINTAELSRATGGAISSREESSRNGEDSAQPRSSIDEGEAGNGKDENWETEESGENEEESANCEDEEADEDAAGDDEEEDQPQSQNNDEEPGEAGDGSESVASTDNNGNSLPGEAKYFKENDKQHPAYIPKEGKFFMHDVRTNERDQAAASVKSDSPKSKVFPREWQPQTTDSRRWQHDMYPHSQNQLQGKAQLPKSPASTAELTAPKACSNLPLPNVAGNRRRGSGLARSGRAKASVNESYSATYNETKFTPDTAKKRNARNAGSAAGGRSFNRASKNLSTTEDEIAAADALIERQGPPWARKMVTSGNFVHSGGIGTYPGAGSGSRKQQHSDMSAVTCYRNANRSYKESDDSGYNVDDFEASGTSFNHRFNGNNIYHVQQRIDDGSRHGAFLSARRQVYRPQTTEKIPSESKQKREGYKKMGVSYDERGFPSGKGGKQDTTPSRSFDLPVDMDGSQRAFSKKKAHSRERDTKSTIDRYNSTLERSKISRNESDASRRGAKSRIEVSQRNKSGTVGVFDAHRKGSSEKKGTAADNVDRTDSSDVDHDHRSDRKKGGDQFETPPRFERLSNSSTNGLNTDGMLSSKKIGVTRPFVLNCNRQDMNLDSDHQIGYIASEEQDVSDSAANSIGHHHNSNKSSYMNNNRGNRKYSASRRVTSPQNNNGGDSSSGATPSSSSAAAVAAGASVTSSTHHPTSLNLFGNHKLKGGGNVNTIRQHNSISQQSVDGFLSGLANNAINNSNFVPMTHHQQQPQLMTSRGAGPHDSSQSLGGVSSGGGTAAAPAGYFSGPGSSVVNRGVSNSNSHHPHHHQTSLQQRNLLAANAQVGAPSAPPSGMDLHNYGGTAAAAASGGVSQMGAAAAGGNPGHTFSTPGQAPLPPPQSVSHQLAAVTAGGNNPHLAAASFQGGFSQNGVSAAAAYANYFNSNLMGADASLAVAAAQGVSGVQSGGAGAPHQYNPMHAAAAAMYYYPAMAAAAAAQQYISTGHAIAAPPPSTAAQMGGYPSSAASALLQGVAAGGGNESLTSAAVAAAAAVGALTESQQMDLMAAAAMASAVPYQPQPPPPPSHHHPSHQQTNTNQGATGAPQGPNQGGAPQMHPSGLHAPSLLMQQQQHHHPGPL